MLGRDESFPSGYTARAARTDDLNAVAALLAAVDVADYGETTFGEDFLRREWARSRFQLATDTVVVATGGGSVVGYAEAFPEDRPDVLEGVGLVHPSTGDGGSASRSWPPRRLGPGASSLVRDWRR